MHPSRLAMLAARHAPQVAVVSSDERSDGVTLMLACGHVGEMNQIFMTPKVWSCRACGESVVRNHPMYRCEF